MALASNENQLRGQFTSDGTSATIDLPWQPSRISLINFTQFASAAGATPVITAEWRQGMDNGTVFTGLKTNGAATIAITTMNATNGISIVDTSIQTPEAAGNAITAITDASPAVVSKIAHGYIVGDTVRLYGTTGMLQIAGMEFSVTAVGGVNVFTIGTLDASGFAAAATGGTARRLPNTLFYPRYMWITSITQAASAVIQMSLFGTDLFVVGQMVTLKVPAAFGMVEADGQSVEITAVNNATGTITVDMDSSAFTAFAFPTSAIAAAGVDFPLVVPFGNVLTSPSVNSLFNQATLQVRLGTSAIGGNGDVMEWIAERALAI
ncbi:MAG: hypothetical protein K940chlam3_00128 [Chlamydiae bacterium]|nr:hypothetical protein [Chlamydiota bacterium]